MKETMRLRDPGAVRAVGHPLRLELLSLLRRRGPSTASELARSLGESSGSTSYHLRQLAKHGLIEEVADRGNRRDRWWQLRARNFKLGDEAKASPAYRRAMHLFHNAMSAHEAEVWSQFREDEAGLPRAWSDAAFFRARHLQLTAAELRDLQDQLEAVLAAHVSDRDRERRGGRSVYVTIRAVPMRDSGEADRP